MKSWASRKDFAVHEEDRSLKLVSEAEKAAYLWQGGLEGGADSACW